MSGCESGGPWNSFHFSSGSSVRQRLPLKSGSRKLFGNYRPVTLLCCEPKLLETLILNEIPLLVYGQIHEIQFVFRPKRAVIHQMLFYLDYLHRQMDSKHPVTLQQSSSSLGFSVGALGLTSLYWLANLTFCTGLQLHKKVHVQGLASE